MTDWHALGSYRARLRLGQFMEPQQSDLTKQRGYRSSATGV